MTPRRLPPLPRPHRSLLATFHRSLLATFHRSLLATFFLAAAAWAVLAACTRAPGASGDGPVRIISRPAGASDAAAAPAASEARGDSASRPRISIDLVSNVLQVVNANLDQDIDEEQVIAVKVIGEVGSPVRIVVADADPASGTYYYQSWQAETNATDSRVFSLSVTDLIGDHGLEIIASGMNAAGRLTLDVFRPIPAVHGKGLVYRAVCQLEADEIFIEESERPDSYSTDQKPGPSFPIIAYLRDPESPNVMDLVRIRYEWSQSEGRYAPGLAEKIPGEKVQQSQLQALYNNSGEEVFEQFISGSWVYVEQDPAGKRPDTYGAIIDFDVEGRKIGISSSNTQEVYLWRESHRTIYNRLLVIGENETVPQIQLIRTFSISIDAVNSLSVAINNIGSSDSPPVRYMKVTEGIAARLTRRTDAQVTMSPLKLSGTYSGAGGLTLVFEDARVAWTDRNGVRKGMYYVLFTLGARTILTTRVRTAETAREETMSWLVEYRETKNAGGVVRSLGLSPVHLTVKGSEDASGNSLALEQKVDAGR
jgi:hypothetical protein